MGRREAGYSVSNYPKAYEAAIERHAPDRDSDADLDGIRFAMVHYIVAYLNQLDRPTVPNTHALEHAAGDLRVRMGDQGDYDAFVEDVDAVRRHERGRKGFGK